MKKVLFFLAMCSPLAAQVVDPGGGGLPGVTVTGTPVAGQVVTATGTSTATWAAGTPGPAGPQGAPGIASAAGLANIASKQPMASLGNVFNAADPDVTVGQWVNTDTGALTNDGAGYTNTTSGFIPGNAGGVMRATFDLSGAGGVRGMAFYDANKAYVSGDATGYTAGTSFTVPANAAFVRVSYLTGAAAGGMVYWGTVAPPSQGWGTLDAKRINANLNQTVAAVRTHSPTAGLRNLVDQTAADWTPGYHMNTTTGALIADASWNLSNVFPANAGGSMSTYQPLPEIAYFDATGAFLSATSTGAGTTFTVPSTAVLMRVAVYVGAYTAGLMVVDGSVIPTSYAAGGLAPITVPLNAATARQLPWIGLKAGASGDSIYTGNVPDAIFRVDQQMNWTGSTYPTVLYGSLTNRGAYSSGTTYAQNDSVTYGGQTYYAVQGGNINNQPDVSPVWWNNVSNIYVNGGLYAGGTTYAQKTVVYYGGRYYGGLQAANTGHQPDTSPTWWADLASTVDNLSISGRQVAGVFSQFVVNYLNNPGGPTVVQQGTQWMTGRKAIVLSLGTNDHGTPKGTSADAALTPAAGNGTDGVSGATSLVAAARYMIGTAVAMADATGQDITLLVQTPYQTFVLGPTTAPTTLTDVTTVLKAVCAEFGVPYLDGSTDIQISSGNWDMTTTDRTHPNANGENRNARPVARRLTLIALQ